MRTRSLIISLCCMLLAIIPSSSACVRPVDNGWNGNQFNGCFAAHGNTQKKGGGNPNPKYCAGKNHDGVRQNGWPYDYFRACCKWNNANKKKNRKCVNDYNRAGCNICPPPPPPAKGYLDEVTRENGQVRIVGWACDPGVSASINVHVYLSGTYLSIEPFPLADVTYSQLYNVDREEAVRAQCGTRGNHGYEIWLPATTSGTVDVYAISRGPNVRLTDSGKLIPPRYCGLGQLYAGGTTCSACPSNTYQTSGSHRSTSCTTQQACGQGQTISADSKTSKRACVVTTSWSTSFEGSMVVGAASVGLRYWSFVAASYSTAAARTGSISLKHALPASGPYPFGDANIGGSYFDLDVLHGAMYTVSAWARAEGRPLDSADGHEQLWLGGATIFIIRKEVTWGSGGQGEWTNVELTTPAMPTTMLRVHLHSIGPVGGGIVYWDDISVQRVLQENENCDPVADLCNQNENIRCQAVTPGSTDHTCTYNFSPLYKIVDDSQSCDDEEGWTYVETEAECEAAASSLHLDLPDQNATAATSVATDDHFSGYIFGCFYQPALPYPDMLDTERLKLNTEDDGSKGMTRSGFRSICKPASLEYIIIADTQSCDDQAEWAYIETEAGCEAAASSIHLNLTDKTVSVLTAASTDDYSSFGNPNDVLPYGCFLKPWAGHDGNNRLTINVNADAMTGETRKGYRGICFTGTTTTTSVTSTTTATSTTTSSTTTTATSTTTTNKAKAPGAPLLPFSGNSEPGTKTNIMDGDGNDAEPKNDQSTENNGTDGAGSGNKKSYVGAIAAALLVLCLVTVVVGLVWWRRKHPDETPLTTTATTAAATTTANDGAVNGTTYTTTPVLSVENPVFAAKVSADNGLLASAAGDAGRSNSSPGRKPTAHAKTKIAGRALNRSATYGGDTYSDTGSTLQSGNHREPVPTGNTNGIVYAAYAPTDARALGGQATAYSDGLPALDVPGPYSAADPRTESVAYSDGLPPLNTAGSYSLPDPLDADSNGDAEHAGDPRADDGSRLQAPPHLFEGNLIIEDMSRPLRLNSDHLEAHASASDHDHPLHPMDSGSVVIGDASRSLRLNSGPLMPRSSSDRAHSSSSLRQMSNGMSNGDNSKSQNDDAVHYLNNIVAADANPTGNSELYGPVIAALQKRANADQGGSIKFVRKGSVYNGFGDAGTDASPQKLPPKAKGKSKFVRKGSVYNGFGDAETDAQTGTPPKANSSKFVRQGSVYDGFGDNKNGNDEYLNITAESNLLRSLSGNSTSYEPVIVQRTVSSDSGPPARRQTSDV